MAPVDRLRGRRRRRRWPPVLLNASRVSAVHLSWPSPVKFRSTHPLALLLVELRRWRCEMSVPSTLADVEQVLGAAALAGDHLRLRVARSTPVGRLFELRRR